METNKYPQDLVLEGYGVKLKRLTYDKIEMLRQWRNDPKIQQYMIYRETITPEMQERWFQKINNDHNFYFIIEYDGKEIGCINIKDVDYEKKCGESGVFIYDDKFLSTDISYRAHLVMFDYVYEILKLKFTYSHILSGNSRAIRFAEFLGSKKDEVNSNENRLTYFKTLEDYFSNRNRTHFIKRWEYYNKQS